MNHKPKPAHPSVFIDRNRTPDFPHHHIVVIADVTLVIRVQQLRDLSYTPTGSFYIYPLTNSFFLFEVMNIKDDSPTIQKWLERAAKKYIIDTKRAMSRQEKMNQKLEGGAD